MSERPETPDLPPRATLDTWTVPELPDDFADRVVQTWHTELARGGAAPLDALPEPSAAWRRWGIAALAAGLAAAAVLLWWVRPISPHARVPTVVEVVTPAPAEPRSAELAPTQVAAPVPVPPLPEAEATTLNLTVDVTPASASVRVFDGPTEVVAGGANDTFVLPAPQSGRSYVVEASADGYVVQRTGIEVEGHEATLRMELTKLPSTRPSAPVPPRAKDPEPNPSPSPAVAKSCVIRLGARRGVDPAAIKVDGVRIGTTPIAGYRVTCERHKITWEWPDGKVLTESIVLSQGESRTLKRG